MYYLFIYLVVGALANFVLILVRIDLGPAEFSRRTDIYDRTDAMAVMFVFLFFWPLVVVFMIWKRVLRFFDWMV